MTIEKDLDQDQLRANELSKITSKLQEAEEEFATTFKEENANVEMPASSPTLKMKGQIQINDSTKSWKNIIKQSK